MAAKSRKSRSELLTVEEAAKLLHLHVKRVQLLAREGRLPAVRHGRRWLFDRGLLVRRSSAVPASAANASSGDATGIDISARNQLRGRVRAIAEDGLMAEVTMAIDAQDLVAVITRSSAERLRLTPGMSAVAVVKSTEVMIARRHG